MDKAYYQYIAEVEMEIFRRYKVMLGSSINNMTMLDLQCFVQKLNHDNQEEEKQRGNGNKDWIRSLFAIGDIINYMRASDRNPR